MASAAMNAEALKSAFEAFNQQSTALEASYRRLQEKVTHLTQQLEVSQAAQFRELREKERLGDRLSRLLEALPGAVVLLDGDGIIRECNERATTLLDQPLVGCAWSAIVRREFRRAEFTDGDLKRKDGRWLSLARRPLESEPGEILLLTDVTETRRLAELLQRAERLSGIGEMTARLGHQIRTPLTSAMLYASRLAKGADEEQRETAQIVINRLRELGAMVDDMLRYAAGVPKPGHVVGVGALLDRVAETMLPQFDGRGRLAVVVASGDEALAVRADAEALQGALTNLVSNALQSAADGRDLTVELGAVCRDERVCLTVADNGHGIDATLRERIFEPFFTTRPQGTGLGLAVVRSVAAAHEGEVGLESGPGGSTFSICLPLVDADDTGVRDD